MTLESDYYALLNLRPGADDAAIRSAYEALCRQYDPARVEGMGAEIVALTQTRRAALDEAFTVLTDPRSKGSYDLALAAAEKRRHEERIDYRPLPPAKGRERSRDFDPQPLRHSEVQASSQAEQNIRLPVTVISLTVFTIVALSLVIATFLLPQPKQAPTNTTMNGPAFMTTPQPGVTVTVPIPSLTEVVAQFETPVAAARQITIQQPNSAVAWADLGNALFDSAQVVLELAPTSPEYQERTMRWFEASDAYSQSLRLAPGNMDVRADLAVSLCRYGSSVNEQPYIDSGLTEAHHILEQNPKHERAMLALALCLSHTNPPQTQRAADVLQAMISNPAVSANSRTAAQRLLHDLMP